MSNTETELVLNPSFIIPAFYASAVLNVVMIYIVARLVGALRRVLIKIGDKNTTIIFKKKDSEKSDNQENDDSHSTPKSEETTSLF